ncbi:MAG TPA: peptide ABC transporter substrate-binding protein [Sulfurivirga caldicuralii]|nr:peptide ABC transporter substrate-binding protein [Sulfurivirga caldicuralii]
MRWMLIGLVLWLSGCQQPWNSPYPAGLSGEAVIFRAFSAPPKHLDPVVSYSANEWGIISQVYEPPLQYAYLQQPYALEPLTLTAMPQVRYLDAQGKPTNPEQAVYSEYVLSLRQDVRYQPHPAFIADNRRLTQAQIEALETPYDLPKHGSRLLRAQDYAYAIKRMGVRAYQSPVLDVLAQHIVGLREYAKKVSQDFEKWKENHPNGGFFDLRPYTIEGVRTLDEHTLIIRIKGRYPQFLYWLSMNFFAPIPWEVDAFYSQAGMKAKNLTLDQWPVGTGPFMLVENNPNFRMRLIRNPNYHADTYPCKASPGIPQGLLADCGRPLPQVETVLYTLEKENIPYWNKFLQGYYDASGVSSDAFDQAVQLSSTGDIGLTPAMREKGIRFLGGVQPTIIYFGFNMLDPVIGGLDDKGRKLRQAISIAVNMEEYISIFLNGRGVVAQGPLPPGIFGYESPPQGLNPVIYRWENGHLVRKPLTVARQLLAEAGYPGGIDPNTGQPLKLYFEAVGSGPDDQARLAWLRKQFAQLGIDLVIRATDYNRFQDKMRQGQGQIFMWGWNADYPDPENFLFLLYGKNGVVASGGSGVNYANYHNPAYDRLFEQMQTLPNGPERQALIQRMVHLVQQDAPWIFGFYPRSLALVHSWYHNAWPNMMANNTTKYLRVDTQLRVRKQMEWNRPVVWVLWLVAALLLSAVAGGVWLYRRRQAQTGRAAP